MKRNLIVKICPSCKKQFRHPPSSNRVNCSIRCKNKTLRKNKKDELVKKICNECKKPFRTSIYKLNQKFCSIECSNKNRCKIPDHLTPEYLRFLLIDNSQKEIGKKYNVSQTTIYNWCKKLGVESFSLRDRNIIMKILNIKRSNKKVHFHTKCYEEDKKSKRFEDSFRIGLESDINNLVDIELVAMKYGVKIKTILKWCDEMGIVHEKLNV
jgi:hypothetical protein